MFFTPRFWPKSPAPNFLSFPVTTPLILISKIRPLKNVSFFFTRCQGFGFVTYQDKEDAADAMDNMHNCEIFGRVVRCNFAQPMKVGGRADGTSHQPVWADQDAWVDRQLEEAEAEAEEKEKEKEKEEGSKAKAM